MIFFQIIGLLLALSPITLSNDLIYFPYSFLGISLYIFASLFSTKTIFPFWDLLILGTCVLSMFSLQSTVYYYTVVIFVSLQFIVLSSQNIKNKFFHTMLILGILSSLPSLIYPKFILISLTMLNICLIIYAIINHNPQTHHVDSEISELIIPQDSESEDSQNYEIPNEESPNKDDNYVIPKD